VKADANCTKLAPYGTDDQLFTTDGPRQLQSHVTQKPGQI